MNRLLDETRGTLRVAAAAEVAVGAAAGFCVSFFVAAFLVGVLPYSHGVRIALVAFIDVVGVGAGAWVVLRRWRPLRHDLVIAARLEHALRRRGLAVRDLVRSAVELRDASQDAVVGRSRALCDAHISRAVDVVTQGQARASLLPIALEQAVPTLTAAAFAMLVLGGWYVLSPSSLEARFGKLFDDATAEAALADRAAQQAPLVTDLTITLRFPAYMAARDEVIPGAAGDVTAPRGTEVIIEGRADRAIKGAALLVTGGPKELALATEVKNGRDLRAKFVVDGNGAWRFRVEAAGGDVVVDPVARKVVVRADAAPSVRIDEPQTDRVVQQEDEVDVAFYASDDVAVTEVRVVVKRQGSSREPFVKKLQDTGGLREARGRGSFNVSDIGARPGEKLAVTIEALDNDTISGPKVGRSATRVLTVFSATQHHREVIQRLEELLGEMVEVLGDELEHPMTGLVDAQPQKKALEKHKALAPRAMGMIQKLDDTLTAVASDDLMSDDDGVRRALANMRLELQAAEVEKRNSVERVPEPAGERASPPALWRRVVDSQTSFVAKLEKHILYLEDLLQRERVLEAQKLVADLKRAQQDLKELVKQYKESGDPAARDALLDEIRRMQQQVQELAQRLGELRREVPDEYLNAEAFQGDEMVEKTQSLDEMIEEGKLDEAAEALENMIEQTQKMLDELDKSEEELGGEDNKELREKLQRFSDELEALEKAQQEELDETQRAMDAARKKAEEKMKQKLDRALADAKKKAKEAAEQLKNVNEDALSSYEEEDADAAAARTADLQKALEAGDIEDALRTAEEAEVAARSAAESLEQRQRGRMMFASKQMQQAQKQLEEAAQSLAEAQKLLDDAVPDPSEMMDAKEREKLGKQGDRQAQLGEQAQKLGQLLDEIGKDAPIFGPEHKQKVAQAQDAMERASRQLKGQGKQRGYGGKGEKDGVRSARQSQSQALQQLKQLKSDMEKMAQNGGSGGGIPMPLPNGGSPNAEPSNDREGGQRGSSKEDVKIPDGSDFKVKDAFRKDILDAMREGAPEDWAGEVKKYYEELIK